MTEPADLIADLSPTEVAWRPLGDVAGYAATRTAAESLTPDTFTGVDNLLANKRGRTAATYSANTDRVTQYQPGDVLLGNIRPYLKKVWLADSVGGCSGDVLAVRVNASMSGQLLPAYLYYVLSSDSFFTYNTQHSRGGKMPRGDKNAILNFPVPIPPVATQRAVVEVLDRFKDLASLLDSEWTARRRQYDHYRERLLSFDDAALAWSTLGGVCDNAFSGGTPLVSRPEYYGGTIPWLRTQEVSYSDIHATATTITEAGLKNSSARWVRPNSVIVAISGAGVTRGRAAVNKIALTTNQHCCNLEVDPKTADYRFVFHWISHRYDDLRSYGQGNRSDLNVSIIKGYPIPLPPLAEQQRIAAALDTFVTLLSDQEAGLPGEITARNRQFEYYRDRLLGLSRGDVKDSAA